MLKEPKVNLFIEMDAIILEVEDEGTVVKIDVTEKVSSLLSELQQGEIMAKIFPINDVHSIMEEYLNIKESK